MKRVVTFACTVLAAALIAVAAPVAAQQNYPSKPITLLIPFPPGTGNDVVGRIVGNKLDEFLGQRVVADNRPGASGNIAIELAKHAQPDGYTLVVASTSFSINQYTIKGAAQPSDFTTVALIGTLPYTLMVSKSVPASNLDELIKLLKAHPGKYNGGTGGPTGTSSFLLQTFSEAAGVDVQMIAYKGTTAGIVDLVSGRTQLMFAPMVTSLPHYRAGKIRVLGVLSEKRSPLMPDVPTLAESGYPIDVSTWFGILGPAGMPAPVVKTLSEAVRKTLASKDVVDALTKQGVEPHFASPADTAAFLKTDSAAWGKLVRKAGIQAQ
jgi:tripartite-type tricarboxylate transporter receptor subunit TctC